MTTAEYIRWYAIEHYIAPVRAAGGEEVFVRLGDVRQGMRLTNPLQSIRSALTSRRFQEEAGVQLLAPVDPRGGADTYCHYRLRALPSRQDAADWGRSGDD